jgi:hypothetical protein
MQNTSLVRWQKKEQGYRFLFQELGFLIAFLWLDAIVTKRIGLLF